MCVRCSSQGGGMTTPRCLHWLLGPASGGLAQRPCSRPRRLLTQCHSHTGDHGHSPGLGTTTAMQAHFLPSSSLRKANLEDKTGTRTGLLFSIIEILSCRKWDSRLTCESTVVFAPHRMRRQKAQSPIHYTRSSGTAARRGG